MMWWPSRVFCQSSLPIFSMFWGSRKSGIFHHGSDWCELPTFVWCHFWQLKRDKMDEQSLDHSPFLYVIPGAEKKHRNLTLFHVSWRWGPNNFTNLRRSPRRWARPSGAILEPKSLSKFGKVSGGSVSDWVQSSFLHMFLLIVKDPLSLILQVIPSQASLFYAWVLDEGDDERSQGSQMWGRVKNGQFERTRKTLFLFAL